MSTYKDVDMRHSYVGTTHLYVLHLNMYYIFICTTSLYVLHLNIYYIFICTHVLSSYKDVDYGVATISRLLKTIGLFCKRAL